MIDSTERATSRLRRKAKATDDELFKAITNILQTDCGIFFDELGITRLFVDEAHNFKNVPIDTQVGQVLGISPGGSKKCQAMMDKVRLI